MPQMDRIKIPYRDGACREGSRFGGGVAHEGGAPIKKLTSATGPVHPVPPSQGIPPPTAGVRLWGPQGFFMLLLLSVALATAPAPPVLVNADLERGMAALKEKRGADAVTFLSKCVAANPALLECRWQLGWAYWVARDWSSVVREWEALAVINPVYESLATQLPSARGQLEAARLAAVSKQTAPATYASTAPAEASLRLRAVGDMMIGTAFPAGNLPPEGGAGTFLAVRDLLRDADITFGNLEGPLCDLAAPSQKCKSSTTPGSCYAFRSPTAYARWYQDAGFDVVSTANNHAIDFGEVCREQTEQALAGQSILYSGRPGTLAQWVSNGLHVAMIGFHTSPSGHWLNDTPAAVALVQSLAGANDVVIVSFHGGAEGSGATHVPVGSETFYGEDRGDLRVFTHAVIDAGADLVLGHGPHVLRAMEIYKSRLIAYSLGNFATYGRFNLSGPQGLGAVLEVNLGRDGRFAGGRIFATRQAGEGVPEPDPTNAAVDMLRLLGEQDFPLTRVRIAQDGTLAAAP